MEYRKGWLVTVTAYTEIHIQIRKQMMCLMIVRRKTAKRKKEIVRVIAEMDEIEFKGMQKIFKGKALIFILKNPY